MKFYVINENETDERKIQENEKNIQDFMKFLLHYEKDPHIAMVYRKGQQEGNKRIQKIVWKDGDEPYSYKLNSFVDMYLQYIQELYIWLNYQYENSNLNKIESIDQLYTKDYLLQLSKYAENGEITIKSVEKALIELNQINAITHFREMENKWLDKRLIKDDKKALCDELCVLRANGKDARWTTIKKLLIDNGYKVSDKRTGNSRYTIITK